MTRAARHGGRFYPNDEAAARALCGRLIDLAPPSGRTPVAIVAPHAGWSFCGKVAGAAFAALRGRARPRRVVHLGPSHYHSLSDVVGGGANFATPLGAVALDVEALERAGVPIDDRPHAEEYALEVQLPFLQALFGDFLYAPLLVGGGDPERLADRLALLGVGEPNVVAVVSSDLSHGKARAAARAFDGESLRALESGDADRLTPERACGAAALRGLMALASRRGWRAATLDYASSADGGGDAEAVVGYAAAAFFAGPAARAARPCAPSRRAPPRPSEPVAEATPARRAERTVLETSRTFEAPMALRPRRIVDVPQTLGVTEPPRAPEVLETSNDFEPRRRLDPSTTIIDRKREPIRRRPASKASEAIEERLRALETQTRPSPEQAVTRLAASEPISATTSFVAPSRGVAAPPRLQAADRKASPAFAAARTLRAASTLAEDGDPALARTRDIDGLRRTIAREGYFLCAYGEASDEELAEIALGLGSFWRPDAPLTTVANLERPRHLAEMETAIPAHNECAHCANPPRYLMLHCRANQARDGAFYALRPMDHLDAIGESYLPSLRGARFRAQIADGQPAIETTLMRRLAEGDEAIVFTGVGDERGGSIYQLIEGVDAQSAHAPARLAEIFAAPSRRRRHQWRPGDLLIIDNLRMMHGRDAFSGGERALRHIRIA